MMYSCIDSCCIYTACLSPALNRSSEIQCFERSDTIEICDGDFYAGLPLFFFFFKSERGWPVYAQLCMKRSS